MADDLHVTSRVVIPGGDLSWSAVRSSGPGGQNVNKVSSKVDLRFDLDGTEALSPSVKARLRALAAGRLDAQGRIQVTSQVSRNRLKNLADARQRLADLIRRALVRPKKRKATKPTRGSQRRRLESKRRTSEKKRSRRPVSE